MPINLSFDELLEYTAWEREKWHEWFRGQRDAVLQVSAGPHGDGRFAQVGELIRHIFSAEKRYVERLSGRTVTDTNSLPHDRIEPLFQFGGQSRKELTEFIHTFPIEKWNALNDLNIVVFQVLATPRKIITHVLTHEIRHWAQIATLLRLNGHAPDFHDFLFSPVMGGEVKRLQS